MYSTFPTCVQNPTPLASLMTWSTWYYLVISTNYKIFRYEFFSTHFLFFLPILGPNTFNSNRISDTINVCSSVVWEIKFYTQRKQREKYNPLYFL
jgi:hypothetical protein